ncbi:Flagellum-specific ATP synthase FliI [hydrothermal vent metagenome]|uniref:Flagellum-specific ATP synthase n=1 Tax=hydrothermal vent metagenome TaxID=652676 RepID=A0A3B1A3B2_9ZZZZ
MVNVDVEKNYESNSNHANIWNEKLTEMNARVESSTKLIVEGKLVRMVGLTLEAVGVHAALGARCIVKSPNKDPIEVEVVGFSGDKLYLMPTGDIRGIGPNARVIPTGSVYEAAVGDELLGRVLDGEGTPLDGLRHPRTTHRLPLTGKHLNPLLRAPIRDPLDVGVRSINALLTVGRGQRMGLFAGSGVGKSILLGMMTHFTTADVIVVGLIGERGREVKEFVDNILGKDGLKRSVVIAVPADYTPVMRLHGAYLATSVAEYFRDQGKQVLLLMDSLTRFAQAQREVALAVGEPPATKGYPPSVFARLPQLVERAGNGDVGGGSITAFYTVLTEGDDNQDPIADAARAILDGHIVLSRNLAESGHFPAIDVEASISRTMTEIVSSEQLAMVRTIRHYYSIYQRNRDLISVGAYSVGSDPEIDRAIKINPFIMQFLEQDMKQAVSWSDSYKDLCDLINTETAHTQALQNVESNENEIH